MAEVRDPASEMEAAELAAGAGDFTSAEQHLNRAVELEEVSFGPMHAGLASILNNLGVVYERLNRPDKAEACYRRAYAVAKASLPPGDPGIELSAANLREFCAARGIPFEPSPSAHSASASAPVGASASAPAGATADMTADKTAERPAAKVAPALPPSFLRTVEKPVAAVPKKAPTEPELPRDAVPVEAPEPAALMAPRTLAISALVVITVIVGVIFVATRSSSPTRTACTDACRCDAGAGTGTSTTAGWQHARGCTGSTGFDARGSAARAVAEAAAPPKTAPAPAPPVARRQPATTSAVVPTLVSAQLCRSIQTAGEWRCTPANGEVAPGSVAFYTRLKAPADTTVEHRWYRGDRLQQKMTLRIRANQGAGYRTFSRATVAAGLTGAWKVELRAMNGTVLHEERFTVRP